MLFMSLLTASTTIKNYVIDNEEVPLKAITKIHTTKAYLSKKSF